MRQAIGESAALPENGYPGEYLIDLAAEYRHRAQARHAGRPRPRTCARVAAGRAPSTSAAGRWTRMVDGQRRVLARLRRRVRRVVVRAARRARPRPARPRCSTSWPRAGSRYEQDGALWFRSTQVGEEAADDKDRVLRRSQRRGDLLRGGRRLSPLLKFAAADRLINLLGPDHHGYVGAHAGGHAGARTSRRRPSRSSSSSSSRSCATVSPCACPSGGASSC